MMIKMNRILLMDQDDCWLMDGCDDVDENIVTDH